MEYYHLKNNKKVIKIVFKLDACYPCLHIFRSPDIQFLQEPKSAEFPDSLMTGAIHLSFLQQGESSHTVEITELPSGPQDMPYLHPCLEGPEGGDFPRVGYHGSC